VRNHSENLSAISPTDLMHHVTQCHGHNMYGSVPIVKGEREGRGEFVRKDKWGDYNSGFNPQ
jgi:hypothetical protein